MKALRFTDQPGRVLAVFVFAPLLVYKGFAGCKRGDAFLVAFGLLLLAWDAYWLLCKAPVVGAFGKSSSKNAHPANPDYVMNASPPLASDQPRLRNGRLTAPDDRLASDQPRLRKGRLTTPKTATPQRGRRRAPRHRPRS